MSAAGLSTAAAAWTERDAWLVSSPFLASKSRTKSPGDLLARLGCQRELDVVDQSAIGKQHRPLACRTTR